MPMTESDWQREHVERRAEALAKALEEFIRIAADVKRTSDERWARTKRVQEAAALARSGKQEEARDAMRRLDAAPVVWDFGRTVEQLSAAAERARAAVVAYREGR